ncbi:Aste57867_1538 [Aphanomyces stellatus]|uniref:Aste57867_1538 protein n=1 Tax=Aphanomyces stellatus TaxID=120398 RepID=A0A485KAV7_9STRA|nr:hypothetical protein As57867_001537 [Aphanomyces stellatus]VFT78753.1 Aste57867_1538 [Aphanomyces stellatus]
MRRPMPAPAKEVQRRCPGVADTLFNAVGIVFIVALPFLVQRFGLDPRTRGPDTLHRHGMDQEHPRLVALSAISQQASFALQMPTIVHVIGYGEQNVSLPVSLTRLDVSVSSSTWSSRLSSSLFPGADLTRRRPQFVLKSRK